MEPIYSFDTTNPYSALTNYKYKNKTKYISALDTMSIPVKAILSGRTVNLENLETSRQSQLVRAIIGIVSIIFFPIIVVSSLAHALKLHTKPNNWEKNIFQYYTNTTTPVLKLDDDSIEPPTAFTEESENDLRSKDDDNIDLPKAFTIDYSDIRRQIDNEFRADIESAIFNMSSRASMQ
ncbi:MAG: hypothetical protein JHC93_08770 [Parachlamydiales bacterium]|nr:hypothetical protein [Parachlamydiales bacterium]